MKIRSKSSRPIKSLALVVGVVVLSVLGWLYYAHHYQKWPFLPTATAEKPANTVDYGTPSTDQAKAGAAIKQQVAEQAKTESTSVPPARTPTNSTSIDITAANKTSTTLMIRTLIQAVTSTGTCTLSMAGPNGATYSASAGVQAMASTSTCQGFNVPLASLSSGTWKITIDFKDGANTASALKEVSI